MTHFLKQFCLRVTFLLPHARVTREMARNSHFLLEVQYTFTVNFSLAAGVCEGKSGIPSSVSFWAAALINMDRLLKTVIDS